MAFCMFLMIRNASSRLRIPKDWGVRREWPSHKCQGFQSQVCVVLCLVLVSMGVFLIFIHPEKEFSGSRLIVMSCTPMCGLGNQMFQYAAGLAVAAQYPQFEVCIFGLDEVTTATHIDSLFTHHVDVVGLRPLKPCHASTRKAFYGWWRLTYEVVVRFALIDVFHPPLSVYVPFEFRPNSTTVIHGWMESFKYFQNLPHPFFVLRKAQEARQWLVRHNISSVVHVRRGDKLIDGSPVVPVTFYQQALQSLGNPRVAVCTDDIAWVRKQGVFRDAVVSLHIDPGFDMAVLSAASEAVVIGVGTFAWWGAYLSSARTKIFYRKVHQSSLAGGYRELDYIPYNVTGQGRWIPMI